MGDWLNNIGTWLKTGDNLKNLSGVLSAGGGIWSGIQQNKMANKMFNLQKGVVDKSAARAKLAQQNLDEASESVYGAKKKQPSFTL